LAIRYFKGEEEVIKVFYKVFDLILGVFVYLFVSHSKVESQIVKISGFYGEAFDYFRESIDTVQTRASILLGHISILLAVLTFSVSNYSQNDIMLKLLSIEIIALLLISLVLLRIIGSVSADEEELVDKNSYVDKIRREAVLRYCYFRFAVFVSMVLTGVLVVGFVIFPPLTLLPT
jgi:hypothetical protein